MVGNTPPGRVQTLVTTKWLSLEALAAVDNNSPMYNERDKAGIFYVYSLWLLVHMLFLSLDHKATIFSKFVLAVADGSALRRPVLVVTRKACRTSPTI